MSNQDILEIRENLSQLPPISQTLKDHGFYTKKNLGQNFIFDLNVTDKIVKNSHDVEGRVVIEVGPGAGSLTRQILYHNPEKIYLIEKDSRCLDILSKLVEIAPDKIEIINDDALNIDYSKLLSSNMAKTKKPTIISNLPYNVGTQLLLNWLDNIENFEGFTLMFQKEVADRICANAGSKDYGRLSIISNLICNCEKLFEVPPTIFFPPPKVYSAIVRLTAKETQLSKEHLAKISKLAKQAFSQKRKTINNTLKPIFGKDLSDVLDKLDIKASSRAEELSVEQYKNLAELF